MTTKPPDRLVTTTELARILGVTPSTITRWATTGRIVPAMQLPGKTGAYLDVINVHLDLADLTEDIDLSAVEFVSAIGVKGWRHGPSVTNG